MAYRRQACLPEALRLCGFARPPRRIFLAKPACRQAGFMMHSINQKTESFISFVSFILIILEIYLHQTHGNPRKKQKPK
jgi:hypothetical protein